MIASLFVILILIGILSVVLFVSSIRELNSSAGAPLAVNLSAPRCESEHVPSGMWVNDRKDAQYTAEEVKHSEKVAQARVHVERVKDSQSLTDSQLLFISVYLIDSFIVCYT